jgi:hypothetical protein
MARLEGWPRAQSLQHVLRSFDKLMTSLARFPLDEG